MKNSIKAICFDVGGTLRDSQKIDENHLDHIIELQQLTGVSGDPLAFRAKIRAGEMKYRRWCKKTLVELTEADLWSKFMLPDLPAQSIRSNAVALNQIWRKSRTKNVLPDTVSTLKELHARGYVLAIISNTTSSVEVSELLRENGLENLISTVILSTTFGRRKPHPSLFLAAARQIGIAPEHCAYVGDNPSRDLIGAVQAGFGEVVLIHLNGYQLDEYDPDDEVIKDAITEIKPTHHITRLGELLDLYPGITAPQNITDSDPLSEPVLYDAALSTMWGVDQAMPFAETFEAARRIGFARFELNHKVTPALYEQWEKDRYYISTVHDPCPASYMHDEIKALDLVISSLDEERRNKGVDQVKRTIELACRLGSSSVVIHAGSIQCDWSMDAHLRTLYRKGQKKSEEYQQIREQMIADRAKRVQPHLDQVVKSLQQIIAFASNTGISIGLENRYRYYDLPLPDEMALLLDLCSEDWYGFQYDTGHAHALHALGLVNHSEWLKHFADRIVGVHLHDVIGITDHQVPGTGEIHFNEIAPFLPAAALRTLEIGPQASLSDLASGLEVLVESGCIQRISTFPLNHPVDPIND